MVDSEGRVWKAHESRTRYSYYSNSGLEIPEPARESNGKISHMDWYTLKQGSE